MRRRIAACVVIFNFFAIILVLLCILGPGMVDRAVSRGVDDFTVMDSNSSRGFPTFRKENPKIRDVYMLNITNPVDVLHGAEPVLREVGPFRYVWHEERLDFEWQPENDTMTYYQREYFTFESAPAGMTEHTKFTIPNLPFFAIYHNAMAQTQFTYRMMLMAVLKDSMNATLGMEPARILFDRRSASELMFGFDSPLLARMHSTLSMVPGSFPGLTPNDTIPQDAVNKGLYTQRVGRADRSAIGQLVQAMGTNVTKYCPELPCPPHPLLPTWATAEASRVNGTCGSRFGQGLQRCSTVSMFMGPFMRSVPLINEGCRSVNFHRVDLLDYRIPDYVWATAQANPLNAQYFMFGETGLINMTTAAKLLPIFASKPHFLDASPALQAAATRMGLKADASRHDTVVQVEPTTGVAMNVHLRLQFSLMVNRSMTVADITVLPHMRSGLLPFMWMDLQGSATETQAHELAGSMAKAHTMRVLLGPLALVLVAVIVVGSVAVLLYEYRRERQEKKKKSSLTTPINAHYSALA